MNRPAPGWRMWVAPTTMMLCTLLGYIDRQVLAAQGQTVYQECKMIAADVQAALRRLQTTAAVRASKKKGGTGAKGKSF